MAPKLLLVLVLLAALPGTTWCEEPAVPAPKFKVTSDFGEESAWVPAYLDRAARVLTRLMDTPGVPPPASIEVALKKDPQNMGLGGWASPTAIGFTSSSWPDEQWRHWILVHELVNLYARHYGGAGGYPSDWWANGRSPFPSYACCLVLANMGLIEDAAWLKGTTKGKPDHDLYWALHKRFGFDLFARFLRLVRADGIDMGKIGAEWPRADKRRSLYTIAYLSLAAGENLAGVIREHGIGRKPSDWDAIHPDKPFQEYEVTAKEVDELLAARKGSPGPGAGGSADAPAAGLQGEYEQLWRVGTVSSSKGESLHWASRSKLSLEQDGRFRLEQEKLDFHHGYVVEIGAHVNRGAWAESEGVLQIWHEERDGVAVAEESKLAEVQEFSIARVNAFILLSGQQVSSRFLSVAPGAKPQADEAALLGRYALEPRLKFAEDQPAPVSVGHKVVGLVRGTLEIRSGGSFSCRIQNYAIEAGRMVAPVQSNVEGGWRLKGSVLELIASGPTVAPLGLGQGPLTVERAPGQYKLVAQEQVWLQAGE